MPLGKRSAEYSQPVVLPDDETVRVVLRNQDGSLVYPEEGGQAPGVLAMTDLLSDIRDELRLIRAHLAILTGEEIASVEDIA